MESPQAKAPATPGGPPVNPPDSGGQAQSSVAPVASTPHAALSAPLFGGLRGGRPRKDGLKPGSPEAIEADKRKDRERKARAAAAARAAAVPAPLPAAQVAPVAGAPPPVGVGALPGVPVVAPQGDFIPWEPKLIKPLSDKLIDVLELADVKGFADRAKKKNLPAPVVKEIASGAKWDEVSKTGLKESTPAVAAKALNKSGISAEHKDAVFLALSAIGIMAGRMIYSQTVATVEAQWEQKQKESQEVKP